MDPGFWAIVGVGIATVTVMGIAALMGYLNYRNTTLYNLPVPSVMHGRLLDGSAWIDFEIKSAEGRPSWEVVSIDMPRSRRNRFLSDGLVLCSQGDPRMWYPQGIPFDFKDDVLWQHRLIYEPPITRGIVLIHSDAPDLVSLRYNIRLRSAPSKRSSLVERYRVI